MTQLTPFWIFHESGDFRTGSDIKCTSGAYPSIPAFGRFFTFFGLPWSAWTTSAMKID